MDTHPVELWTISLTRDLPSHISEDELARANRFKFDADRVRWIRSRSALRMILSRYAGEDPGNLVFLYGKHGKPSIPFSVVQFNLSHAGDWAIIAVSRTVAVGVDIERMRPNVEMARLLERLGETGLPTEEAELYHRWT